MKRKLFCLMLFLSGLFVHQSTKAQTLTAGDIAFVGYHTDADDGFTFIALTDIPAGEVIYFTDKGWNATDAVWYTNAEDHIVWTAPGGGVPMGTVVSIIETPTDDTFTVSQGTAVLSGTDSGFSLLGGDSILAYQSSSGAEPANPTFIAGIYGDDNYVHTFGCDDTSGWLNCSTCTHGSGSCATVSTDTSGLPASLTNGENAVALFPVSGEKDNAKYTGTLTGTVSVVRAAINNPANWDSSEDPINIASTEYSGINITPDAPACTMTASISSQTNVACNGGATGSLTAAPSNGTAPYTYLWDDGAAQTTATATGLSAGTYEVTITDANGCTATASTTVTQPTTALSLTPASQTNVACNGGATGAATVNAATGGTSGYTYNWTPGNPTGDGTTSVSGLSAGTWTCTVTDANGCTKSVNFTVTQPVSGLSANAVATNVSCNGGNDGTVNLTVTGGTTPYTYVWNNSAVTEDLSGLMAGTYSVTVTDANGCTATKSVDVFEPAILSASGVATNVSCNGGSNGTVDLTVTGGTAPYSFAWNNSATTEDMIGLSAGTYSVTVTDAKGCTATETVDVFEPTILEANGVGTNESCAGNDGSINLTVVGGNSPYTYVWSNAATTEDLSGLAPGTYDVTVTDAKGCTATESVTINAATGCATIATVTTDAITVYTSDSFTVGGNVTDDGDAAVTDRGIAIGGTPNPTTADVVVQMGTGEGAFSEPVAGLIPGVTYYVRAYAINSEGTAYGNEVVFTAPYGVINLVHDATTTQYPTIQQAIDASVTGDMITLGAGTYIEQVTVTTGITIQGAGTAQTIVRSPLAADLTVNGGWKTLKAQDVIAIIGIKTDDASQVTIKDLTVDGFDQGYLPDGTYPDKNAYAFQGIGALNTNLIVDNVLVRGVRELATDFGATLPTGYLPADQPSGLNHNEAIFAESAVGAGNHTLEVKNSYIEKFQKTAILAWGPTLEVNIHDNTIQGYGQTLYSTGNGIQIASTDRTSLGGANGDRRGTTGIITNNQILGIGVVIPEPGEDGSYLNLGMYGPSAILPYEAGDNFVISNNTITRTPYQSWYNDYISNDGGFSNTAIAVYNSNNASVTGNTISGFDVAIAEIGALNGSEFNASGNIVSDNRNDYFTAQNNDHIVLGSSAETLTYYATSQGVDLIDNFGPGDRINVVGLESGSINGELSGTLIVDFTSGTVTTGDGSTVAANSIQVQQNATTTTLFIDTDATEDQAELQLELTGLYELSNFKLDGGFIVFSAVPPTASAQAFCDAATVADLDATGTDLKWYDVATGGTALADNTDLSTGTYYVSQTVAGVESDRTSVDVTINTSPTASGVATNVSCNGGSNGTVDLTVTGGTAPYTFVWSNTATTEDMIGLSAGTYDVTVTDANGCTATTSVEVTEPTVLSASAVATNVSCNGGSNGTVDLTVTGGTAPYTFVWSNAATTEDMIGLSAGTYSVTVTDAKGCTATESVTVTEPTILVASGVATSVSCNGGNNGTVNLTVTGGTAPYTFVWSNSATTEDMIGLSAGTYDVTVTDAKGCTATESVEVTEPAILSLDSYNSTDVSCNGGNDGAIDILSVIGGTAPYTFAWSNSATTEDLSGLSAGTYDVTITDAKGCTANATIFISEPTVLSANGVVDANVSCNGGNDGAATISVTGGTEPYAYNWDGISASDVTFVSQGFESSGSWNYLINPAVYNVSGDDVWNIIESFPGHIDVASEGTHFFGMRDLNNENGGGDFAHTITFEPIDISSKGEMTISFDYYTIGYESVDVIGYSVEFDNGTTWSPITELNRNTGAWETVTVNVPASANFVRLRLQATQNGGDDFAGFDNVVLSEVPSQGATMNDLAAGTYDVTVTDAKGCTATTSVTVTEPTVLSASGVATNVSCNGGSNGTVDLTVTGGTAPYTFVWSNAATTEDMIGLSAGTYDVTVTDAKGCTATTSVTVTEPTVLSASGVATNVSCNGGNNGTVDLTVTGGTAPYTFVWSNAATTEDMIGLSAGTYDVTVTDAKGCTATESVTVTEPAVLVASGVATNVSCNGGSNGAVDLTVTGGTAPYTFVWSNAATTEDLSGLSAGTYDVTVTDAKGCTATESVTVTEPTVLSASGIATNVSCNGGSNGTVDLTVTGGTAPYTFVWSNAATTEDMIGLTAGTYDVTVTDAKGCTATTSVTVAQPDLLEVSTVVDTNVSCNGGTTGSVTINLTGGTSPFEYVINGTTYSGFPDPTLSVSGLAAATYPVSVTDANGCTATGSVTIDEPAALSASGVATNVSCNGGNNGTVDLTVTGGTAPYTFVWSNAATTEDMIGLSAGTYDVTVTDAKGCTATESVTVTEPAVLVASGVAINVSCNGGNNGTVDLTVTGGTAPYTFVWSNAATTEDLSGLSAGTYDVTVTDAKGCTATESVTVTEPTAIAIDAVVDANVTCNGGSTGSASVTVTGGTAPFEVTVNGVTYSNLPDNTMIPVGGLSADTYPVNVTDANGCTATSSITITEPEAIVVNTVVDTNVSCFNGNDGSVTINLTNGVAPFEYTIDGVTYSGVPDATLFVEGLSVGIYPINITDANGCTATGSVTIAEPAEVMPPAADAQVFCNFANVSDLVATGTDVEWYAVETGGTPLAGTVSLSTGTYYATQTVDGCESPTRTAVAVTVNITPAPSASAQTFCNAATVAELTASGTDVQWYAAATGGTALADDTALATGTYYVSQTLNDCESTRTAVAITVNVTPAPIADAQVFCNFGTVANLVATGTDIKWYANETGGVQLAGNVNLSTGTYYVSQTLNACEGPRTAVAVTVNVTPAPATVDQVFCNSATVSDLVATGGGTILWYTQAVGGTALEGDVALATGTYYASQIMNDCESAARVAINVTVNVTSAPTADAQVFCNSATVADLVATGTAIQWYADETGGTALANDAALATGTYYASQTLNDCESPRVAVAVTVNVTDAPTADAQVFCNSATVADLVATGTAIQWYADETGGTALANDAALATGTYYVSQILNDCESPRAAVDVTVNVTPAPVADAQAFCSAATVADLMATGDNLQWFADETGGTALAGDVALTNGTTYYVSQTIDGCESTTRTAVAVTITVTAAPTGEATQIHGPDNTLADLEVTGTDVVWYASAEDAAAHVNPLDPATVLEDGVIYYATQTVDGCESQESLAVTVTISLRTDIFTKDKLSYYPVPVVDVLNIENTNMINNVTVMDMLGKVVLTQDVHALNAKIDMRSLQGATYIMQVTTDSGVVTVKVIKNSN